MGKGERRASLALQRAFLAALSQEEGHLMDSPSQYICSSSLLVLPIPAPRSRLA
jgi:hypothetical protein